MKGPLTSAKEKELEALENMKRSLQLMFGAITDTPTLKPQIGDSYRISKQPVFTPQHDRSLERNVFDSGLPEDQLKCKRRRCRGPF